MPPKGTKAPRASAGISLSKITMEIEKAMEAGDVGKLERIRFACDQGMMLANRAIGHLHRNDDSEAAKRTHHRGRIEGVEMFDRALPQSEILELMQKKSPPSFTSDDAQTSIEREPVESDDGGTPF